MAVRWMLFLLASATILREYFCLMSPQRALLKKLLEDYNFTTLRPVYNESNTTVVEFMLVLTQVIELNERHQTIEIGAWIAQQWTDEFMRWDPQEHNEIERLFVHKSKIWLPDITLYKNVDRNFESYKDISIEVRSNGRMRFATPAILKSSCRIDVRLFPFDAQLCQLKFSSWAYSGAELDLRDLREISSKDLYTDVGVWELVNITVLRSKTVYMGIPYPELTYSIELRRQPLFHTIQIIIPCVLLSLLNLMVFVLPPESGEKISLGMANLLSLVLFQQLINNSVPPISDKAPIIGYFFTPMVVLSCSSVICTVVVLNLFYRDDRRPIPSWVKYVVVKLLARLVGYQSWKETTQITGKSGQDPDRFQCPGSDTVEPETIAMTSNVGEGSPSKYHFSWRVGDLEDSHRPADRRNNDINASQPSRDVTYSGAVESPDREDTLVWKDVALVIDRAALILSTVATLISIVVTVSYFISVFNEDNST